MPPPIWTPGQILNAADVNSWFVPVIVVKGSDQSRASNTTLSADSELFVAVAASATYLVHLFLNYSGAAEGTSDIKWQFVIPASATLRAHHIHEGPAGSANCIEGITGSSVNNAGTKGAGIQCGLTALGTLIVAGTSGNVTINWAQNTSNATATIVAAQSSLMLQRLN
jgi:hypothetical protein